MKVAIYVRVSTEEQAKEGYSIDAQKKRLTDFSNSQGWDIYDIFVDDGFSAKNLERPAIQRMIRDLKTKQFDVVLVYKLDRLVRSVMDLHELLILLDKYDVKFKSATEMFDTTSAMGRFFITLVGAMAQWERENLAERVKMGMEQKLYKGERNGAVAPFGYDLVDSELVINPIETQIVQRIYELYKSNGVKQIASILNREKVPKRGGGSWTYTTVQYILTNPVYAGKLRWNYRKLAGAKTGQEIIVDGNHTAIISEEVFNYAQQLRESRQKEGKSATSVFSFTGVLRCSRCGHPMVGTTKKNKKSSLLYYKCTGRFHMGICDMPMIAEDTLTNVFLKRFDLSLNDEIIQSLQIPSTDTTFPDNAALRQSIEQEIEAIQKRKKKWQLAYANDVITLEELKAHTEEDKRSEEYLRQQLESMVDPKENAWTTDDVVQALQFLKDDWQTLDPITRKQTINGLFKRIVLDAPVAHYKGGPGHRVPVNIVEWEFSD